MFNRCVFYPRKWLLGVLALTVIAGSIPVGAEQGHGVGFVVGSTHGIGLSYARQYESGVGWQVSGFPYVSPDQRDLFAGFALFKTLNQGKRGRAFVSFGAKITHHYDRYDRWDCGDLVFENPKPCGQQSSTRNVLGLGPGVGLEVRFFENFSIYLDFPAALYVDSDVDGLAVRPIPNFGLFYRW